MWIFLLEEQRDESTLIVIDTVICVHLIGTSCSLNVCWKLSVRVCLMEWKGGLVWMTHWCPLCPCQLVEVGSVVFSTRFWRFRLWLSNLLSCCSFLLLLFSGYYCLTKLWVFPTSEYSFWKKETQWVLQHTVYYKVYCKVSNLYGDRDL